VVHTGAFDTIALTNDGTAFGWGYNEWGELGLGTLAVRVPPTEIGPG